MPGNTKGRPRNSERVEPIYPDRRKVCPSCKQEKPWRAFYPRVLHPDGTVANIRSACRLCTSGLAKQRWQRLIAAPDARDELNAKRREYHTRMMATDEAYAEKFRRDQREAIRYRYNTDPDFREKVKARARAYNRSPHGRELERQRRKRARNERARETSMRLDPAPWREWLTDQLTRFEGKLPLAKWLGADEAQVRKWIGGTEGIRLDRADRIFCNIGEPHLLMLLWPELYEEAS